MLHTGENVAFVSMIRHHNGNVNKKKLFVELYDKL